MGEGIRSSRGGEGKKIARAYGREDKLLNLGEDQVQASPNYKAKIKTQATSTELFIFAMNYVPGALMTRQRAKGYPDFVDFVLSAFLLPDKSLDESFSSRNHVRKFLRALPTKWRPNVTAIKESKDLSTLYLYELISNLKVYKVVLEKDSKTSKNNKERYKSLALKAKRESSVKETSSSGSEDKEYAMEVRDFKKFFRRSGKIRSWSDSNEEDLKKDEICLMAHESNEVHSDSLYYSGSSLDDETVEY
ncbi:hypothetical protein Tco_0206077 [Tanacetum coccineum]